MTPLDAARVHAQTLIDRRGPVNICFKVAVSGYVTLGFDKGEKLTHERLVQSLAENLCRLIQNTDGDLIDVVYVESCEQA